MHSAEKGTNVMTDGRIERNIEGNTEGNIERNIERNTERNTEGKAEEKPFGRTKDIVLIGVMAALICVLSPISISLPITPVPISLTIFAIYITEYVLGMKKGLISFCIYILLGIAGVPVFSGFQGGIAKVTGPTGGYILGYLFICIITGYIIEKFGNNYVISALGMIVGTAICYTFGTLWLAYQAGLTFYEALFMGVVPFIPADIVKMIIALLVGPVLRNVLKSEDLI